MIHRAWVGVASIGLAASLLWLGCTGDDPVAPAGESSSSSGASGTNGSSGSSGTSGNGSSSSGSSGTSGAPADGGVDSAKPPTNECSKRPDAGFCDDFDLSDLPNKEWKARGTAAVVVAEGSAPSSPHVVEFTTGGATEMTSQLERDETNTGKAVWTLAARVRVKADQVGAVVPRARIAELQVSLTNEGEMVKSAVRVEVDTTQRKLYCFGAGVGEQFSITYVPGTWVPIELHWERTGTTTATGFCTIDGTPGNGISANVQQFLPESNAFIGIHSFANQTPLTVQFDNVVWWSQ